MELKPHLASERAFVWTAFETPDKENEDPIPKPETLAIRFRDAESKFLLVLIMFLITNGEIVSMMFLL